MECINFDAQFAEVDDLGVDVDPASSGVAAIRGV